MSLTVWPPVQVTRIQRLLAQAATGVEFSVTTPAARVLRSQSSWMSDTPRTSIDGGMACSPSAVMTPPQRQSPIWSASSSTMLGPERIAMSRAAAEMGRELIGGVDAQSILDMTGCWLWVCGPGGGGGWDSDTVVVPGRGEDEDEFEGGASGQSAWCYDMLLTPFYTSLCTLFLVPLFSDRGSAEELASELLSNVAGAGAAGALPPGSGRWLADLVSNALPPALVLRAVLLRLQWATPSIHPDRPVRKMRGFAPRHCVLCLSHFLMLFFSLQDISAAISVIDERFSSAAVECQPARGAGAATLLGSFGEFFRRMEFGRESGSGCKLSSVPETLVTPGGIGDHDRASPKLKQACPYT
jgi:hypothetical protein